MLTSSFSAIFTAPFHLYLYETFSTVGCTLSALTLGVGVAIQLAFQLLMEISSFWFLVKFYGLDVTKIWAAQDRKIYCIVLALYTIAGLNAVYVLSNVDAGLFFECSAS
jgi:uncharacterized membrane protein